MCGRFTLHTPAEILSEHFGLDAVPQSLEAVYNIAPSREILAVRLVDGRRELTPLRWGLIPPWARDMKIGTRMINARAETAAVKPAYRTAFRRRRCLIPADGFYEWRQIERAKQPYHIRLADGGIFAFAGLWERWTGYDGTIESCSILVTEANDTVRPIHDRMPVIVPPGDYSQWLDPALTDPDRLTGLLGPYTASAMVAYPVTNRVNYPANDGPGCIEPMT